jgi:hypothetical protein
MLPISVRGSLKHSGRESLSFYFLDQSQMFVAFITMLKKLYVILGLSSLVTVLYLLLQTRSAIQSVWAVSLAYAVLVGSIHGLIAHTFPFARKSWNMFYPVLMGILFGVMMALFIYLVLPNFVPPYTPFF